MTGETPDSSGIRVGYVLKMYPRFSETFIVTELLSMEEQGVDLEIFSLRSPVDGRFHESLARVKAPVCYLDAGGKASEAWETLRRGRSALGSRLEHELDELLDVSLIDACQAIELALAVRRRGITRLHAHFATVATTVARLASRLADVPYSFTLHAKDIFHEGVDQAQLRTKLADSAAAITVSDFNERYLTTRFGDSAKTVVRVYNGIDLDLFSMEPPVSRPPVVVAVGRLVEKKGFHHLLDAIALLVRRGRPVHLDLVGGGIEEAGLKARADALGVSGQVTFHGPLTQFEARDRIRGAAVLAAPCVVGADGNRDGLPTVILEGLALGTPVVATPVTGIPEAVVDGHTGLLVPEGDVPALADALCRLLDDPDLRCRLAEAGRRHVEANFDSRVNVRQLREVMTGTVRRPTGVGA